MFSKRIDDLKPYIPGEQPKDRPYIKLNANENPYPPSPAVAKAVSDFVQNNAMKLALYPDPDSNELRQAIADHLNATGGCMNAVSASGNSVGCNSAQGVNITPDMIFCGNGSDEVLSFIFYTFFDSAAENEKNALVAPVHTYSFYPVYCGFYGIPLETVALNGDFTLNTDAMLEKAAENKNGIIFANPNAPTSLALSVEKVRSMLEKYPADKVFIVDEAYVDFGDESCLCLLGEFKNLVIVRTFSKSMCGAGMRLGYCVANPELIKTIFTVKNSFNHFPVDAVTQVAGIAACRNTDYYIETTKKVVATRERFQKFLAENGWDFYDSKTNFVLTKKRGENGKKIGGEEIYQRIKQDGILVRHFSTKGIEDYIRVTIGTDGQMDALMDAMRKI